MKESALTTSYRVSPNPPGQPETVHVQDRDSVSSARVLRAALTGHSDDGEDVRVDCHFTDNFMHSRSRHALPRLRGSIGIRAATVATKPAVRTCVALVPV